MIIKYKKRPVEVDAIQFLPGINEDEIINWIEGEGVRVSYDLRHMTLDIHTLEGIMTAVMGDWIIKGVADEFYPCKPDIFERTYSLS